MTEVKWIKLSTNIFDDETIKLIEQMPEGDAIIVIWFKLLVKAGLTNNNGLVYLKENIPYTEEMLATVFNKPLATIRLALRVFEQFKMIEITNANEILIKNWEKHQNVAGMEQIKEYNRLAKRRQREKQKQLAIECQKNVLDSQGQINDSHETDIDKDKDIEEDIDKEIKEDNSLSEDKSSDDISKGKKPITIKEVKEFVNLYNSIVVRLSKVETISNTRSLKVKARLKNLEIDKWREVFEKMEASDFCCGINKNNWKASFDWIIANDNNYVKVLEGKYDNKKGAYNVNNSSSLNELQKAGMDIL